MEGGGEGEIAEGAIGSRSACMRETVRLKLFGSGRSANLCLILDYDELSSCRPLWLLEMVSDMQDDKPPTLSLIHCLSFELPHHVESSL